MAKKKKETKVTGTRIDIPNDLHDKLVLKQIEIRSKSGKKPTLHELIIDQLYKSF